MNDRPDIVYKWDTYGCAKIVVAVNSEEELLKIRDSAKDKHVPYYLVADAGRTQVDPGTKTVCAIGPGGVSEIDSITGHLSLL